VPPPLKPVPDLPSAAAHGLPRAAAAAFLLLAGQPGHAEVRALAAGGHPGLVLGGGGYGSTLDEGEKYTRTEAEFELVQQYRGCVGKVGLRMESLQNVEKL
jgi:hypothetical protein